MSLVSSILSQLFDLFIILAALLGMTLIPIWLAAKIYDYFSERGSSTSKSPGIFSAILVPIGLLVMTIRDRRLARQERTKSQLLFSYDKKRQEIQARRQRVKVELDELDHELEKIDNQMVRDQGGSPLRASPLVPMKRSS